MDILTLAVLSIRKKGISSGMSLRPEKNTRSCEAGVSRKCVSIKLSYAGFYDSGKNLLSVVFLATSLSKRI